MPASEWSQIALICFAKPGLCAEVERMLVAGGYAAERFDGEEWLARTTTAGEAVPVVLFGEDRCSEAVLGEVQNRTRRTLWFGLFEGGCAEFSAELPPNCADFLGWPCEQGELVVRLRRCGAIRRAQGPSAADERMLEEFARLNLVGRSPAFLQVVGQIRNIGRSAAPVLIQGETGTGKELVAHAIHYLSQREPSPFIPVNCGAIPDSLIENELFGHQRGAYTDARTRQAGLVEQADGGTLFLDEVETLTAKAQVVLLRFLQNQEYQPLGGGPLRRTNVRIIAASNVELRRLVRQGDFRSDLFYRLNILTLSLPPLRQRPEDVEPLAVHFLDLLRSRYGGPRRVLHPRTLAWMRRYQWPGNVRELENVLHRAFVMSQDEVLLLGEEAATGVEPEPAEGVDHRPYEENFQAAKARLIEEFEREYLTWLMTRARGCVAAAARMAGKERRALGKLLKKHGLAGRLFRGG